MRLAGCSPPPVHAQSARQSAAFPIRAPPPVLVPHSYSPGMTYGETIAAGATHYELTGNWSPTYCGPPPSCDCDCPTPSCDSISDDDESPASTPQPMAAAPTTPASQQVAGSTMLQSRLQAEPDAEVALQMQEENQQLPSPAVASRAAAAPRCEDVEENEDDDDDDDDEDWEHDDDGVVLDATEEEEDTSEEKRLAFASLSGAIEEVGAATCTP